MAIMSIEKQSIWQTLQQAKIVQGEEPKSDTIETFWHTKILLAISGWLAALFLFLFLGLEFYDTLRNPSVSLILGGLMIAGGFALLYTPKNDFYENLALAISFAGQALIVWAIFQSTDERMQWLLTSLFFVVIALVIPNYIHRVFGSFLAASTFSITLFLFGIPSIGNALIIFATAFLWLHEFDYPKYMSAQRAIGYGLVLTLIYININGSIFFSYNLIIENITHYDNIIWMPAWIEEFFIGAIALYVAWQILKRYGHKFTDLHTLSVFVATMILSAISIEVYGVITSILILLLGFSNSNRVLMGLGIASLLFSISSYYYLLNITLLGKAQNLLILGLVLLAIYWLLSHFVLTDKEVKNA